MLLSVENHIQASFLELLHGNAIWKLGEDLYLVDSSLFNVFGIGPLAFAHLGRRDEAQDLDCKFVILHGGVDEEEEGLGEQALVLRVVQQLQVVLVDGESGLIDG